MKIIGRPFLSLYLQELEQYRSVKHMVLQLEEKENYIVDVIKEILVSNTRATRMLDFSDSGCELVTETIDNDTNFSKIIGKIDSFRQLSNHFQGVICLDIENFCKVDTREFKRFLRTYNESAIFIFIFRRSFKRKSKEKILNEIYGVLGKDSVDVLSEPHSLSDLVLEDSKEENICFIN